MIISLQRYKNRIILAKIKGKGATPFPLLYIKCDVQDILLVVMSVKVSYMCYQVLVNSMLSIGTTNATLLHSCVETLHCLKVLTVDVGFSELQTAANFNCCVYIAGEYR